ncbi:MAG: HlyD family secretion protein [Nostoc sp.]
MNVFDKNNLITYSFVGIAALGLFSFNQNSINKADAAKVTTLSIPSGAKSSPIVEAETAESALGGSADLKQLSKTETNSVDDSAISILQQNRPLRISLSVDNPSFLKVKVGQQIKQGDVISDNSLERSRLDKQKKSVSLQIDNLKSKIIPQPFKPTQSLGLKPLPPAIFSEESATIAQSKMKRNQSQSMLEARTQLLQTDNPERRAEAENTEAGLQIASQKVEDQEQMIQSMQDMKLSSEILQHEDAELKKLRSQLNQANSAVDQAKAKLNASAILQQQELQQLQVNVRLAQSEIEVAESKLIAAQNRRQLTEYDANLNEARQQQQENQTQQEYSRQQQQYAQSVRDRDYQLAQLNISFTNIEDKLAQIPMLRSPRNGYVRRIKPWVGVNGRYTTTITISADNVSSKNGGSDSPTNSTGISPNPSTTRTTR